MIARLLLLLICIFMLRAVKAETCGGRSGPPCNASLVYAALQTAYLAAITPNLTEELCVVMVRLENNKDNITLYLKNGTADFKYTETYRFTDAPDVVNITLDHNTSKTYEYQMLYADYGACFVANFGTESVGCRLWMFENATSTQITACKEGHAQACQGAVDDTWDEESCTSILDGA